MGNKDIIKRFNVVIEDMESLHLKISRDKEYVERSIELLYGLMNDVHSEMLACRYSSILPKTFSLSDAITIQGETYRRERTCRDQHDILGKWHCSYCNYLINYAPKYCPHCGSKVVK